MSDQSLSFPHYIDSSMLSTWRACRRKHFWSTLRSLYPMGKSVHLIAGGAFAAGIEAARRLAYARDLAPPTVDEMLHAALPAFARHWGDFIPPDKSSKTFENTFYALEHYLCQYHPSDDLLQPMMRPDGTPAVEYKFAVPIDVPHPETGEPIFFSGRFDMVGNLYDTTATSCFPCVVDEKTTGSLGMDWANKWDLRGQFLGYCWALQQQGINCSHAVINGIAILKTKNEIQRAIVRYPNFMLSRWHAQMLSDVKSMVLSWKAYRRGTLSVDYAYPYNFADSCESYGGCAFTTLCSAGDPEAFTNNYTHYRYDPLSITPVQETQS